VHDFLAPIFAESATLCLEAATIVPVLRPVSLEQCGSRRARVLSLDPADMDALELLTWRVRLATSAQLDELTGMPRIWRGLLRAGLVEKAGAVVAVPELDRPLATWAPGQPAPRFSALAWKLVKRRRATPSRRVQVFWATDQAIRIVGGIGGRIRQPMQVEHDLGTTAIFLRRRVLAPDDAKRWFSEDIFRWQNRCVGKVPDALLNSPSGDSELAIEFGGAYSTGRIRGYHRACAKKRLPWELW